MASSFLKRWGLAIGVTIILLPSLLLAQQPGQPEQPTAGGMLSRMLPMFVMVFLIFYLMVIKPQKAKLTEQQNLLANLKKGEQVVTSGGIVGRVSAIEKEHVALEIAQNVKIKVELAHIAKALDRAPAEKA